MPDSTPKSMDTGESQLRSRRHKVHLRDRRLFVNAGVRFPACYANSELLDTDKSKLQTTGTLSEVTCKNCLRFTLTHQLEERNDNQ